MKRDFNNELRGSSRRDFIKGVLSASAALGLGPTRALEVLDQLGGSALAAEGCVKASRSVNIVAGNGSLAWFSLLWPAPKVIETFQPSYAYDNPAKAVKIANVQENRKLYVRQLDSGKALWENFGAKKRVTAAMCGLNTGHENAPRNAGNSNVLSGGTGVVGGSVQVYAGQASLQTPLQALVPVIGLSRLASTPYGPAPGAPPPLSSVPDGDAMVGLFSSAASRRMERLGSQQNKDLFNKYYTAFLSLAKTADRATYQRAYTDYKVATSLVAKNLGTELAVKTGQVDQWVGPAGVGNEKLAFMAGALIVTANAFRLGLTSQVNIPVFMDDPHGAFGDGTGVQAGKFGDGLASILQSFMDELAKNPEPSCQTQKISDNIVFTVSGDLGKRPFDRTAWPDDTPGGGNWVYVMSNGWMKPGWFGDMQPGTGPGTKYLFDPRSGAQDTTMTPAGANPQTTAVTNATLAAVLFAIAQGDDRAVRGFFTGDYEGLINKNLTGA